MSAVAPVTVVIPAHNAAGYLPVTIDSVLHQTMPPEAVIVVDDGSTDDTAAVARAAGATVLSQAQAGPAAARNHGVRAARSEFVAFLDADDWYAPSKLERSIELLHSLGAPCMATDAWQVIDDRIVRRKNQNRVVPSVLTKELLIAGNPIVCSAVVCRRDIIEAVGWFDETPDLVATEDYDLWLRVAHREPIAYLHEPLTFYRAHSGSLSSNVRFMRGVDRILAKVATMHAGEAHFANLIARRRAAVRLDVVWDMLQEGRRNEARQLLRESRALATTWKSCKLWLRSMLPLGRRPA